MQHNLNPFVQDENQLNRFLTSKYGAIAKPFITWRTTLNEEQKSLASPRLMQSMLIIYKGTMSLEKAASIMPKQLDKDHFCNIVNDNILFNFSKNLKLNKPEIKSFNMDEDHVKKFIFEKYGAVATAFVNWRETLNENEKKLATPRLIQNIIHLHMGNIPLKTVAGLLPTVLDKTHFENTVKMQLDDLAPQSKFNSNKITALRNQHNSNDNNQLKI